MLPRRLHRLVARFALAWFALTLGAAILSPLVQPRAMRLVCSAAGVVKLVADGDQGPVESGHATLDCPLCLLTHAPPQHTAAAQLPPAPPAPQNAAPPCPAAPVVARSWAPLPARGPPAVS
jgi:hypothetical protein